MPTIITFMHDTLVLKLSTFLFLQAGLPSQSPARKRSVKGFVACMQKPN